jgi:hypothetical protein
VQRDSFVINSTLTGFRKTSSERNKTPDITKWLTTQYRIDKINICKDIFVEKTSQEKQVV